MSLDLLPERAKAAVCKSMGDGLDVQRIRKDFPILHQRVHDRPLIYLDNAATTQKPLAVLEAMRQYYERDNANVHRGVHYLSERATAAYESARVKVQKLLHANCTREIIFTRGATEAVNLVANSFGRQKVSAGDEVVVTMMEHHSNIVPWQMLCLERGATLRPWSVTEAGELEMEELDRLLTPKVKLLALVHVSNLLGTINPVKKIIAKAHERGIPVLLDGAQAAPHLRIDVQDLDCDFYALSSHKLYGPTGIGVLYGKARHLEAMPPWQGGGDMIRSVSFEKTTYNERPYKFEAGTPAIAEAVGLGAAIDYLDEIGYESIEQHEHHLLMRVTERLSEIKGLRIVGQAADKAAVVSFVFQDPAIAPLDLASKLDVEGIAVRSGHHCCQPLCERLRITGTARASFGIYNTIDEVDALADTLDRIATAGRQRVRVSVPSAARDPVYPPAYATSPDEAADKLVELFESFDTWLDRYQYIIEIGQKLPAMPAELKTEENRVRGCQSTVYLSLREKPGSVHTVEFLADSDADIVRGLLRILQRLFCGQSAANISAFDIHGFFARLGLEQNLTLGRRNGLAEMVKRVRAFAGQLLA